MSFVEDAALNLQVVYTRISQFLGHEAMLLDENRLREWLGLLDPQLIYEIPIRLADEREGKNAFPKDVYRVRDDLAMIRTRIERIETGEAWAETPPTRTVRLVGSIAVERGDQPDVYRANSAILVFRQRAQDEVADMIPARRRDLIRILPEHCTLLRRTVVFGETILKTPNLGIFF